MRLLQRLNALWVLALLFLREILYQGPLHHLEEARRTLLMIPAALATLGAILSAFTFIPFLTVPVQLLPPSLFWECINALLLVMFLLVCTISLYLWDSLGMTGVSRRILLPVLPGPLFLVLAKLMAHAAVVMIIGFSFLLPSLLYITIFIAPIIHLPLLSFSWHLLLGSLALIWAAYAGILGVRILLDLLPGRMSTLFSVLFRLGLIIGLVLLFLTPTRLLEPWLGSPDMSGTATQFWPVAWSLTWIMDPFRSVVGDLSRAAQGGRAFGVLLLLWFVSLQWLGLRLHLWRLNPESGTANSFVDFFGAALWQKDALATFFFRALQRTALVKHLLISMAVPAGMVLAGMFTRWREGFSILNGESVFFAMSSWLIWAVLMLIRLSAKAGSSDGLWVFDHLPREGLLQGIRQAYFKVAAVWLFVLHLPVLPVLAFCFSWGESLRMLTLSLTILLGLLLGYLSRMTHIPFTSCLVPDHWQIHRFWLLYLFGYTFAVWLMAGLLDLFAFMSWMDWGLVQGLGLGLLLWLWRGLKRSREGEVLVLEGMGDPVILSIEWEGS
jgi:hypothetical protein